MPCRPGTPITQLRGTDRLLEPHRVPDRICHLRTRRHDAVASPETVGRGIAVDHVTIYRWVQRFTPLLVDAARPRRHAPGDRWFVDETYVKVAGQWVYLYQVIDQHGRG